MNKIFLDIGQYITKADNGIVYSVLGSCLGIIFYDNDKKFGCFCHGFLPSCNMGSCDFGCLQDTKYVNCAIEKMVKDFSKRNLNLSKAFIAVIGGGNLIKSTSAQGNTIGELNIQSALKTLAKYNLKPTFMDIGDKKARKFFFNIKTGELKVESIN
jgi:chemotaxis protein CheD